MANLFRNSCACVVVDLPWLFNLLETYRLLHHRTWYLLSLCAVLLLGPWYREFVGGISILIIFLEVWRARRPTTLAGLAGLFFLHAVFPTALVKLVAFPELPLRPVFALGQLGVQIQRVPHSAGLSAMSEVLASLRWQAVCTFLLLLPPTALGLALLGYLIPNYWQENRINPSESSYAASGGVLFLAVWTLVFLVPFLKVFTLHAHLAYPLMPFSILTAIGIERLCYVVWQQNHFGQFLRYSLGLVLIIGVGDHLLNIYGSYRTVHGINHGNLAVANWFKTHVPKGSIVISNALHVEDIRLFSNGHIIPYWTVDTGIVEMKRAVETTAKLEELLGQNKNLHEIYFLDVNYNFTPDKVYYHSHKYVRNESVEMKNLGLIQTIRVRYPYLDPLRAFTPRSYILFLGGGDLENDFYHGPAQDGTPFLREIYAEYHVYQATGTEVAPWDPNVPWSFVESGFEGFNIFQYGDRYLGIAQRLGPVDLHWLNRRLVRDFRAQGGFVIGQSLNEVKGLVSQLVAAQRVHDASVPILVEAAYRGFNLVQYQDRVYAIPQGEGAFEIERIKRNQYTHWFAGASAEEVKGLVAASVAKD
jgi:hypothetical protein